MATRVMSKRNRRRTGKPTAWAELWGRLSEEKRKTLQDGDAAMGWLLGQNPSIERWLVVGTAANEHKKAAMELAGTDRPIGSAYNKAWRVLGERVPNITNLDNGTRTHAMWMASNWEVVNRWRHTLATNERVKLNHPSAVKRRYEATHCVPGENGQSTAKSSRARAQDQIARLQEEVDALKGHSRNSVVATGTMSPEEIVRSFQSVRNVDFLKQLRTELDRVIAREEGRNPGEAGATGK